MGKAEDLAVFQKLLGEYGPLFSAGDVSKLVPFWTDDFTMMPANEPTAAGKEACRKWHANHFEQFSGQWTLSPDEAEIAGDWAFVRIFVTARTTLKASGEPIQATARMFTIFKRAPDGAWKWHRCMWNSDKPLPG